MWGNWWRIKFARITTGSKDCFASDQHNTFKTGCGLNCQHRIMQSLTNRQIDGIDRRVGKLDKKHLVIAIIAPEFYCHVVPFWLVGCG
jgi:hypothetical protein